MVKKMSKQRFPRERKGQGEGRVESYWVITVYRVYFRCDDEVLSIDSGDGYAVL